MSTTAVKEQPSTATTTFGPQPEDFFLGTWFRTDHDPAPARKLRVLKEKDGGLTIEFSNAFVGPFNGTRVNASHIEGALELTLEGDVFTVDGGFNGQNERVLICNPQFGIAVPAWEAEEDDDGRGDG